MSKLPHRSVVGETKAIFFIGEIPVLVDREDLWFVLRYRWNLNGKVDLAVRVWFDGRVISLSQFLMADVLTVFDHKNRKFWDNRKVNLRPATKAQNAMNHGRQKNNSSGYRGVSWCRRDRKWVSQIIANRKEIYLGRFEDKMDAVSAFNEAVKKYHGEFAVLS